MSIPASAAEKQTRNPYQGLIPNSRARTRPVAGYHAAEARRDKTMTSGWLSRRKSSKKARETNAWRIIKRLLSQSEVPTRDPSSRSVGPGGGKADASKCELWSWLIARSRERACGEGGGQMKPHDTSSQAATLLRWARKLPNIAACLCQGRQRF